MLCRIVFVLGGWAGLYSAAFNNFDLGERFGRI